MCWLQHAQLCRVSGHNEAAGTASLEALARDVPGAALERARLLWDRDQQHDAILKLKEVCLPWPLTAASTQTHALPNSRTSALGQCKECMAQGCRAWRPAISSANKHEGLILDESSIERTRAWLYDAVVHHGVTRASLRCRSQEALCCHVQVIAQTDTGPGGRSSQLSANSKANAAEMVLQLACWTAATGQGVRGDIAGRRIPSAAFHSGRCCVRGGLPVRARPVRPCSRDPGVSWERR